MRRAIVLHELIHVRRRDWAAALAEEILLAMLWFHPWAWWVRAQIRVAREEVVDREAATRLGARDAYAACLLAIAGYELGGIHGSVAMLRRRELRHRLETLLQEVAMSRARLILTFALLGNVLIGGTAGASRAFPLVAAAPSKTAGTHQRDDKTTLPRLIKEVKPVYPPEAKQAGVEGSILLAVTVGTDGKVGEVTVQKSVPELDAAAVDAVRQWEFEPGKRDGIAVSVVVDVEITFTLD